MQKEEMKELMRNNNDKLIDLMFEYFEKLKEEAYLKGWHDGHAEGSCKKEEKLQDSTLFDTDSE